MTLSFIGAVKGLHLVSNETREKQNAEFKRFINEFGTHYAQQTILGKIHTGPLFLIITRARLRRAAGELDAINHTVRFLHIYRA